MRHVILILYFWGTENVNNIIQLKQSSKASVGSQVQKMFRKKQLVFQTQILRLLSRTRWMFVCQSQKMLSHVMMTELLFCSIGSVLSFIQLLIG